MDVRLPGLPRFQTPRVDADLDLIDIRKIATAADKFAKEYARAAVELNRPVVDDAMVRRALIAYYDEGDLPAQNPKLLEMMRAALQAALGAEHG